LLQHCSLTLHVAPSVKHCVPPLELDALDDEPEDVLVDMPDDVVPEELVAPPEELLALDFPLEVLVVVVALAPVPPPVDPHAAAPTPNATGIHAH
jgi:hypothetical protein